MKSRTHEDVTDQQELSHVVMVCKWTIEWTCFAMAKPNAVPEDGPSRKRVKINPPST